MQDRISEDKLKKYRLITTSALGIAKKNIIKGKEEQAGEIISMAENYLSDSCFFENKKDFVSAFAAINYAHGWIDSGARLGIFKVSDNKLFTVRD